MRWKTTMLLLFYLAALAMASYPFLNAFLFERQADGQIQYFLEAIEMQDQPETEEENTSDSDGIEKKLTYPELYEAMKLYNASLFHTDQLILDSVGSYEQPALTLSDYGLNTGDTIGYISIPAMEVELPLYLGASEENMAAGAVVLGGTSLPIGGENTNCVIAGHRGYRGIPYFREIETLQKGDLVEVTNPWETLIYQVVSWEIIQPDDVEAIKIQTGKDMITLLTCHPYRVGTQRYLVYCERVEEQTPAAQEPFEAEETVPTEPTSAAQESSQLAAFSTSSQEEICFEQVTQLIGLICVLLIGALGGILWLVKGDHEKHRN